MEIVTVDIGVKKGVFLAMFLMFACCFFEEKML
jgi:hypothetical protein